MKKRKLFYTWEGWVGLVGLIIGAGIVALFVWYLSATVLKDVDFVRVEATIVDIAEVRVHDRRGGYKYLYAEVVEYEVDGITYSAQNNSSSTAPKSVGSKITVAYDPANPENCFFPSSNYSFCVLAFVLAAGFIAAGGVCLSIEAKERKMEILMAKMPNATFITSAATKEQFIKSEKPIIAVCGKSNVGKSSFINMLAGNKKLARVSKEPGRTRLVNYFDFGSFVLADLPGYGFARVSKSEKLKWAKLLDDFFADKNSIAHVFALTDIRHDPTADDLQMSEFLYYHLIPFTVVATKGDKLSRAAQSRSVVNIAAKYKCGSGNVIVTSAQTRQGLDKIYDKIQKIINGGEEDE